MCVYLTTWFWIAFLNPELRDVDTLHLYWLMIFEKRLFSLKTCTQKEKRTSRITFKPTCLFRGLRFRSHLARKERQSSSVAEMQIPTTLIVDRRKGRGRLRSNSGSISDFFIQPMKSVGIVLVVQYHAKNIKKLGNIS